MICERCGQDSHKIATVRVGSRNILVCRACMNPRGVNSHDYNWDHKDSAFRNTSLTDIARTDDMIMKHPELQASYNPSDHRYEFDYRGHLFYVEEREIMWEDYPMNVLATKLRTKLREIDKKEDFDWEPRSDKLSHSELLTTLEGLRR